MPVGSLKPPTKPVKKIITRGSRRCDGQFASRKMAGMVPWASFLARDFAMLAETDPVVTAFYAQPYSFTYVLDGRERTYVPDFLVHISGRQEIHAVLTDAQARNNTVLRKMEAVEKVVCSYGPLFSVTTESAVRRQPVFKNATLLARHIHDDVAPADLLFVQGTLDAVQQATVGMLQSGRLGRAVPTSAIYRMMVSGEISYNAEHPIGQETVVWRSESTSRLLPFTDLRSLS